MEKLFDETMRDEINKVIDMYLEDEDMAEIIEDGDETKDVVLDFISSYCDTFNSDDYLDDDTIVEGLNLLFGIIMLPLVGYSKRSGRDVVDFIEMWMNGAKKEES